jgi:hypothetical protein
MCVLLRLFYLAVELEDGVAASCASVTRFVNPK